MGPAEDEILYRRMAFPGRGKHGKEGVKDGGEKIGERKEGEKGKEGEGGKEEGEFVVEQGAEGKERDESREEVEGRDEGDVRAGEVVEGEEGGEKRIGDSALRGLKQRVLGIRKVLGSHDIGLGRSSGDQNTVVQVDSGAMRFRMPTKREFGFFAWEFLVVVALVALLRRGVARTLRWLHARLGGGRGLRPGARIVPYENSVFECMQRPLEFISIFMVGTALAEVVSRPLAAAGLLRYIKKARELGVIFAATWFLLRWIDRIKTRFAADRRIDKAQVDATSRISTVATTLIALLISLDTIGINIQTVLAFGGIGGVAIGFAGREIISNFFGGFMIYITRPFTVGEWIRSIESQAVNGTVEDIGWYLTRVRTWDKRPLYIPNSRFSTLIIENPSRMTNRRIVHTVHVRIEDMPVVHDIIREIQSFLMSHPGLDPKQHRLVYVDGFDEFSVKLWISCYTKSVFLYDFRGIQQQILLDSYGIIRTHGARIATITTRDVRHGGNPDIYGPLGTAARGRDDARQEYLVGDRNSSSNGNGTGTGNGKVKSDESTINFDSLGDGRRPVPLFGDGEGPRDVPVFASLWDNEKTDFFSIESGVRSNDQDSTRKAETDKRSDATHTKAAESTKSKEHSELSGKQAKAASNSDVEKSKQASSNRNADAKVPKNHQAMEQHRATEAHTSGTKNEDKTTQVRTGATHSAGSGSTVPEERRMKFSAAPRRGLEHVARQGSSSKKDDKEVGSATSTGSQGSTKEKRETVTASRTKGGTSGTVNQNDAADVDRKGEEGSHKKEGVSITSHTHRSGEPREMKISAAPPHRAASGTIARKRIDERLKETSSATDSRAPTTSQSARDSQVSEKEIGNDTERKAPVKVEEGRMKISKAPSRPKEAESKGERKGQSG